MDFTPNLIIRFFLDKSHLQNRDQTGFPTLNYGSGLHRNLIIDYIRIEWYAGFSGYREMINFRVTEKWGVSILRR